MAEPIALLGIKGRFGVNKPFECPDDQVIEAINVDWFRSSLGRKRRGASSLSLTGGTAHATRIISLFSHIPSDDQSARELWSIDESTPPRYKRLAGGTAWADVTVDDASVATFASAVSFNGKLFFGAFSAVDRLHCWDPADGKVRRVGLAKPAGPTVANTGTGTYSATFRNYRVQYRKKSGSDILLQSDLSALVGFTPSGAGAAARVTKPAALGEGETHWAIYGSPSDGDFVEIVELAVATTFFDDNISPSSYVGDIAPDSGAFAVPPSLTFLVADDARIVGARPWAGPFTRVMWTSVLGSTDKGDDERVSNTATIKSFLDVDEPIRAISYPISGSMYVFSWDSHWKLVQTGNVLAPYTKFRVTGGVGCVHQKTIVIAEDETGETAIYWLSPHGPYRRGNAGQQSLKDDISDIWDRVNLTNNHLFHGVYHKDLDQIWWWIAVDGSLTPNLRIVFDIKMGRVVDGGRSVRRGWVQHTGTSCEATCSAMMSNTIGASMSLDLKPYIGRSSGVAILKCDDATQTTDAGTPFQASMTTRPYSPWGLGQVGGMVEDAILVAKTSDDASLQLTVQADFDPDKVSRSVVALTQEGQETRRFPKFGDTRTAEANIVQFILGDAAATAGTWDLDVLLVRLSDMGYR